jgi:hypothetical protein
MKLSFRRLAALSLLAAAVSACGAHDSSVVAPRLSAAASAPSSSLLGSVGSLVSVDGLQRVTALAAPITVARTIGAEGGTLSIPQAGVSVTVPRGALTAPTQITMTARAGTLVAYDFAPHGITFAKPLVFTQQLRGTDASLLTAPLLQLGYYADASLLTKVGGVVSELLGGATNLVTWSFSGKITHFSGYIVTCGRRGAE